MKRLLAVLVCLSGPVLADEWRPLSGDEIATALTDRDLVYPNAKQRFYASGRTLYNAGQDSWGYWAVRGDQYAASGHHLMDGTATIWRPTASAAVHRI